MEEYADLADRIYRIPDFDDCGYPGRKYASGYGGSHSTLPSRRQAVWQGVILFGTGHSRCLVKRTEVCYKWKEMKEKETGV